jgi:4-hydroxybenzoate polyprenyltransferase
LDGTLLRTDSLWEMGLLLCRRSPAAVFSALGHLVFRGRAALKVWLGNRLAPDVSSWPIASEVLDLVARARQDGRAVVLVTGAPECVALAIAHRLGEFDDVIATQEGLNLTGKRKASALIERFGRGGFDYVGDSPADLPVWTVARHAIAVDSARGVRRRARSYLPGLQFVRRGDRVSSSRALLRAMRPHQWSKNVLVLAPVMAAHAAMRPDALIPAVIALVAFCLVASGTYLANDLMDLESDRHHARKRNRPLASGDLPLAWGFVAAWTLLAAGLGLSYGLGLRVAAAMAAYSLVTLLYSLRLKQVVALDVVVLAILYTFRILVGVFATGVELSHWFLAFSMFLFTSLAFVKRASELRSATVGSTDTLPGRGYSTEDLYTVLALGGASAVTAVLVLALYATGQDVTRLYHHPERTLLLCPLLLYWLSRIWFLTMRGHMHDDPIVFALRDRVSWLAGVVAAAVVWLAS